jgi:hypothetical protein
MSVASSRVIVGVVVGVVVGLGGCGSGEREPVDTTPVTIETLDGASTDRLCTILVRCGVVDDMATCRGQEIGLHVNADLVAAVRAGKVIFRGDDARACLNGLLPSGCDESLLFSERGRSPACDTPIEGTVASGGACAFNEECLSGACSKATCADACCLGTCFGPPRRPARLGEACFPSPCAEGFCDRTTDTCKALLSAGAACSTSEQCRIGLVCHGTCQTAPGPGEPCDISRGCRDLGLVCNAATRRCTAVGLTGDRCGGDEDCSPLYDCGSDRACALRPQRGQPCTTSCGDRSFCEPTTHVCAPPQAEGAPCMGGSACESGYCDFDTNTCAARPICI